jgi:Amt family ammonium transporter
VQPWAAAAIGIIAGVVVIEAIWIVERKFKIDDPVGAISVHGVCGTLGVLSVGIFSDGQYGTGWNGTDLGDKGITGILYGGTGWGQLAAQIVGVLTIWIVMGGIVSIFFKIQDKLTKGGIRAEEADEIAGMDMPEMGVFAYPAFVPSEMEAVDMGLVTHQGEPVID